MRIQLRTKLITIAIIFGIFLAGIASPMLFKEQKAPDTLGPAPHFSLTDSDGKDFNSDSLKHKVLLMNFFFTGCESMCPAINGRVASVYAKFKGNPGVQFLSVSIDPANDTPGALKEYAQRFKADTTQWHFLEGPIEVVRSIGEAGFHLGFNEQVSLHTTRLVLVDGDGEIRGYYDGNDDEAVQKLASDISFLSSK